MPICATLLLGSIVLTAPDVPVPVGPDREAYSVGTRQLERDALAALLPEPTDTLTAEALESIVDSSVEAFASELIRDSYPTNQRIRHADRIHTEEYVNHPHPLIRALAADAGHNGWQWDFDPRPSMTEAVEELATMGFDPPRLAYLMAVAYLSDRGEQKHKAQADIAERRAVELCADAMRIRYDDPIAKRRAFDCLVDASRLFTAEMADLLDADLLANPPEDAWLMHAVLGEMNAIIAWNKRGTSSAANTTDAQFEGFRKHMAIARRHLTAAHELNPDRPEPAARMISVEMGENTGREKTWFRRAYEAQPDYAASYSFMRTALMPRWGGSPDRIRAFALWCAEPDRPPLVRVESWNGLLIYADEVGPDAWKDNELVDIARGAIETVRAMELRSFTPWFCDYSLVRLEAAVGDKRAAAAHLRSMGGELPLYRLQALDRAHRPFGPELLPFDSTGRPHALIADTAETEGDWHTAASFWALALEAIDPQTDPLAHAATADRLLRARRMIPLLDGQWIDIDFSQGDAGVRVVAGVARIADEHTIELERPRRDVRCRSIVVFDLPISGAYEIECDAIPFGASMIVGWSPYKARDARYVAVSPPPGPASLKYSYSSQTKRVPRPQSQGPSPDRGARSQHGADEATAPDRVRVRVEGTKITMFLNGVEYATAISPSERITWGTRVGFGYVNESFSRTVKDRPRRISNIRVRLLGPADDAARADEADQEEN